MQADADERIWALLRWNSLNGYRCPQQHHARQQTAGDSNKKCPTEPSALVAADGGQDVYVLAKMLRERVHRLRLKLLVKGFVRTVCRDATPIDVGEELAAAQARRDGNKRH